MTYQRAVQAVLWGMPAVSMVGFRKHLDELGVGLLMQRGRLASIRSL